MKRNPQLIALYKVSYSGAKWPTPIVRNFNKIIQKLLNNTMLKFQLA